MPPRQEAVSQNKQAVINTDLIRKNIEQLKNTLGDNSELEFPDSLYHQYTQLCIDQLTGILDRNKDSDIKATLRAFLEDNY